jgi:hypothetical protein
LTIFGVKSSIIFRKLAQIIFFSISKINNWQFCENCSYKKWYDNKFFPPVFCCSGMGKNQDLGYGINIPDLQHWNRRWDGGIEVKMRKTEQEERAGKCGKGG